MIAAVRLPDAAAAVERLLAYGPVEVNDVAYVDVGQLPAALNVAALLSHAEAAPVGLARGKFPAYAAALQAQPPQPYCIQPGQEADTLRPLPVNLLPLSSELARQFGWLGLRTLGDLAKLPSDAVLARFGHEGRALQRLAQGRDRRPLQPTIPEHNDWLAFHPDEPIADWRVLGGIVDWLADELIGRLDGQAARTLHLLAGLENGERVTCSVTLTAPSARADRLKRRLGGLLLQLPVTCGVVELRVELGGLMPASSQQLTLFAQQQPLDEALDDLAHKYGQHFWRVAAVYEADHLPERRWRLEVA